MAYRISETTVSSDLSYPVFQTGLDPESINVVLDKGTLDALLPPGDESAVELVEHMFDEVIYCILKPRSAPGLVTND